MKVLCICERGNSRSVGMAWLLKDLYGIEAIAIGISSTTKATKKMLLGWADVVVCMQPHIKDRLEAEFGIGAGVGTDLHVCDVGVDAYWRGVDERLEELCEAFVQETLDPGRKRGQTFYG